MADAPVAPAIPAEPVVPVAAAAPAADAKPGDAAAPDATKKGEPDALKGAPEKYEAFTLPEGFELDAKALEQYAPVFKELGLDQAGAQKLVDLYAGNLAAQAKAQETALQELSNDWAKQVKEDKEIGGKNYDATVKLVTATVDRVEQQLPGLKAFFNETQTGNHPMMVKLFAYLGKAMGEDKAPPSIPSTTGETKPLAERMYANSKMNP